MLLLACRHHVTELRMVHFWSEITGEKTTGPDNPRFKKLKNTFENPGFEYDMNDLVCFDWKSVKGTVTEKAARPH